MATSIRLYDETKDFDEIERIYTTVWAADFETIEGSTISFYLYCAKYLKLSPKTCFVAVNENDHVVGYLVAVANSSAFVDGDLGQDPYCTTVARFTNLHQSVVSMEMAYVVDASNVVFGSHRGYLGKWLAQFDITVHPKFQVFDMLAEGAS